jgi:hypothetical protein
MTWLAAEGLVRLGVGTALAGGKSEPGSEKLGAYAAQIESSALSP